MKALEWLSKFLFKYILCLGSTKRQKKRTGKGNQFKYILCLGSTAFCMDSNCIHYLFKYILCLGSTRALLEHEKEENII